MPDLTFKLSKKKLLMILLGTSLFVFLGSLLIIQAPSGNTRDLYMFMGTLSIIFFGFVWVNALVMLLSKKPMLELSETGFTVRGSMWRIGFVDWTNVDEIREYGITSVAVKQIFIRIVIKDKETFLENKNWFHKTLFKWSRTFADRFIDISVTNYIEDKKDIYYKFIEYFEYSKGGKDE